MAVPEILEALAEQWDRVDELLDEANRATLHELIAELNSKDVQDEQRSRTLQSTIVAVLLRALPTDDPIRVLEFHRLSAGTVSSVRPAVLAAALGAKLPSRSSRDWILGFPWEPATELRGRGVDPDLPDLIRLDHPARRFAVPMFQFDGDGSPVPVVLQVNQLLGAWADPWGVAYWWLADNVWLAGRPARLIDEPMRDLLVAAAEAAVEG